VNGDIQTTPSDDTITRLRTALGAPLPGLPAQLRMSPDPRPGTERILEADLDCRRAAVLALLYPGTGGLNLVLTRRTEALANHRGQISFPGGSLDNGETVEVAALREAEEELGIQPGDPEILGRLSPLYIPHSGFCVYPVVAYMAQRPHFTANPDEVAEVIEIPLAHLLSPATCFQETWELRGAPVRVPFFAVGPHKVWGATAMMLSELLAVLPMENQ
jgi:8-oxo-dGTP pyrophosphatase MutT (NUDIX family)